MCVCLVLDRSAMLSTPLVSFIQLFAIFIPSGFFFFHFACTLLTLKILLLQIAMSFFLLCVLLCCCNSVFFHFFFSISFPRSLNGSETFFFLFLKVFCPRLYCAMLASHFYSFLCWFSIYVCMCVDA